MTAWDEGKHPRGQAGNSGQFKRPANTPPTSGLQSSSHRFDRDELVFGLKDVIGKLKAAGEPATIRIVGGAAISMLYWGDRGATQDIDAQLGPADVVLEASARTAAENGWPSDWLNDKATMFLPSGYTARTAEWVTVHDKDGIVVEIATAETLLAMKLNSALRRRRREIADLTVLLGLCAIDNVDDAEDHFRAYYGDDLNQRAVTVVEAALAQGVAAVVAPQLDLDDA